MCRGKSNAPWQQRTCKTRRNVLNHVALLCYTLFGSPRRNTVPPGPTEEDVAERLDLWRLLMRQTPMCAAMRARQWRRRTDRAVWQACHCGRRTSTITARSTLASRPVVVFSLPLSPSLHPLLLLRRPLYPVDSFTDRARARARLIGTTSQRVVHGVSHKHKRRFNPNTRSN